MKYSTNQFLREHQIIKQFKKLFSKIENPAKSYPTDARCKKCLARARKRAQRNLERLTKRYPDLYHRALNPRPEPTLEAVTQLMAGAL